MSTSKIQSLTLKQFTAFEEASFEFCPGINVLIGANSTGKTHVMKIIYTLLKVCETVHQKPAPVMEAVVLDKIYGIFRPSEIDYLIHYPSSDNASVLLTYFNTEMELTIQGYCIGGEKEKSLHKIDLKPVPEKLPSTSPSVYLPPHEFLSINKGFISSYTKRELAFDETYYDLALALDALPLRYENLSDVQDSILLLTSIITGIEPDPKCLKDYEAVTQENGQFYFNLADNRKINVHLVAEGYRKIATLLYLLKNGSLTKESILFWDEPEANLNPKLITEIVKVLQKLALSGMQIFIATHDYLLSHELSLLAEYPPDKNIEIRFFALHKPDRNSGVQTESARTLAEIKHNPILEEFAAHYDRESELFYKSSLDYFTTQTSEAPETSEVL